METKKCPFCSEEILFEAKKCKHCGEFLDLAIRKKNKRNSDKPKEGCFLQTMNIGCVLIIVIVVISFIIFSVAIGSSLP